MILSRLFDHAQMQGPKRWIAKLGSDEERKIGVDATFISFLIRSS
jgi:hypothetical protein